MGRGVTQDYTTVTEMPGLGATGEQMAMLCTRYTVAAARSDGKDVLEVACGSGIGLGQIAQRARHVVGADLTESLLRIAQQHYGGRIPLVRMDAHALPFRSRAFDVVVLYEATYYLREIERFLAEGRRVLRTGGVLLICSANRECHGFQPSPFSVSYLSASELREVLTRHGFAVELFAAFPVARRVRRNSLGAARWLANAVRLSPGAKALAKRMLFGNLLPFPAEVAEGMAEVADLVPLAGHSPVTEFQVLYAIGRVR